MAAPTRFFVYGTLMPGEPLWPALAPYAASWRRATVRGRLWDTGQGYPCVRFDGSGGPVPGVLVTLRPDRTPEAIAALDAVEEEGRLYRRVNVETSAGPAFAYEWLGPVEGMVALPDGWRTIGA
jgi:gamma-glutamylcyclotransferase (GGCT)/AIG2-like uncharacterized protein YtfP